MKKKEEKRKLLEEEMSSLKVSANKTKSTAPKVTKAQIDAARQKAEHEEKMKLGLVTTQTSTESKSSKKISSNAEESSDSEVDLAPLEENINRLLGVNVGDGSARNVEEALILLG